MRNSLRPLFSLSLIALSLGTGCYGADPSASVVQEAALCGEDILIPTSYTCVRAVTNIRATGTFEGTTFRSEDGRTTLGGGTCTVTCHCDWSRISEAPSCGANRFADEAERPLCADGYTRDHLLMAHRDVSSAEACTRIADRSTDVCAEVCQLSAQSSWELDQQTYAWDALRRLEAAGTPVQVPQGAPITSQFSQTMYCCAPNPLRRGETSEAPVQSSPERSSTGGSETQR